MDLIPKRGDVIVDALRLDEALLANEALHTVDYLPNSSCKKEMDVVILPTQPVKRIVSIPHLPKFKVVSVIRSDIRALDYRFASSGRNGELWVHDGLSKIATIRRSDKKTLIFGQDAYMGVTNYLVEIQRRGVSLTQATDIVCNELGQ